jgi:tripartite-type tricarboxylate transporter receptor subunit TctC
MRIWKTPSHCLPALLTLCLATSGHAQDDSNYPNQPIRVIAPVGAGAGVDTAARVTAEAVEKHLGQRLIIENKPGAGMRIGTALAAKSQPDGYTLLFVPPAPVAVLEHFPQKLDYDPRRDFRPVAIVVYQPVLFIVRPSLGVKTVAEFVAHAKGNPGKVSFGIQGLGNEQHVMVELFKTTAGINVTLVPYNAAAQGRPAIPARAGQARSRSRADRWRARLRDSIRQRASATGRAPAAPAPAPRRCASPRRH